MLGKIKAIRVSSEIATELVNPRTDGPGERVIKNLRYHRETCSSKFFLSNILLWNMFIHIQGQQITFNKSIFMI